MPRCLALIILLGIPLEPEGSQPRVKKIGYLDNNGDRPTSSLLGYALPCGLELLSSNTSWEVTISIGSISTNRKK
jgi:hypothetical protein